MVEDAIKTLGKALVPPGIDPLTWWRIAMAGTVFSTTVVLSVHLVWAATNFAKAADVAEVARLQLEDKLDEVYTIICTRPTVDQSIVDRARALQRQYAVVNDGKPYEYDCELLEKLAAAQRREDARDD